MVLHTSILSRLADVVQVMAEDNNLFIVLHHGAYVIIVIVCRELRYFGVVSKSSYHQLTATSQGLARFVCARLAIT